jgi:transcriptional regulator with XRE-family HTH domain
MSVTTAHPRARPGVGPLLRDWRQRRRLSQLDLANEAAVSARHLSFVETGRSRPSRELVMHLAEHLDVPLRERNSLLLAAGYAPRYEQTPLEAHEMAPVREALDSILAGHEPFPAVVVDRTWDIVTANAAALAVLTDGVAAELLAPPANAMRIAVHPEGMAPRIVNFAEYATHLIDRLRREARVFGDRRLLDLVEELVGYPGVAGSPEPADTARRLFVPLVLRAGESELAFFSTIATFGTARDVTVDELAIESFFPADAPTAAALRARWG